MDVTVHLCPYDFGLWFGAFFALVPKLQLGNLEGEALASRDRKLELPVSNSQAGAWELAKIFRITMRLSMMAQKDAPHLNLGISYQGEICTI